MTDRGLSSAGEIRAVTFDFANTLVPVNRQGFRAVVDRVAADAAAAGLFHDEQAFVRAWDEERDRDDPTADAEERGEDTGGHADRDQARRAGRQRHARAARCRATCSASSPTPMKSADFRLWSQFSPTT